ncbi:MAG: response regulator transcription factor [Azonexus sp.]|nr:response regulator transcription factor [Azonexus sp.]
MNILIVDPSSERRALVDDALSWVSDQYVLQQTQSLMDAKEQLRGEEFQLVIVGPELPEDTFAALVFLRGWLPHTPLLTYTKMSRFDRDMPARLLDCGANLVFDQRMSATQLGLVLRPYLVNKSNVHQFATRKAAPLVDQPAQRAPREQVASFG